MRSPCASASTDHSGDQAVTLADRGGHDEPQIPLAIVGAGGIQDPFLLQVNHQSVDGALVALGVQTQFPHQVGAGVGTALDQSAADRGADDGVEHRFRW